MFCGRVSNENVNRVQRRALRAVYNDYESNYKFLLAKGDHLTIHERNLQFLLTKVYKCLKNEVPSFCNIRLLFKIINTISEYQIA